jgi:competence protein ComEA
MQAAPSKRGVLARAAARVIAWRFARPIARAVLVAAGLVVLALIGRTAVGSALADRTPSQSIVAAAGSVAPVPAASATLVATAPLDPPTTASSSPSPPPAPPSSRGQATPDDPVYLNTATVDDLRRLPGIGEKRANAIVALRTRLGGRLRAVEDLMKVKGIGRTTLKRLRPLVRLDPPALPDAG